MNAEIDTPPTALVYDGAVIRDRGKMLSLRDMWKAEGAIPHQKPADWLRDHGTQMFVEFVANREKVLPEYLFQIAKGRTGATYAHWQIGLAYAKYFSPEFHMWCNKVVCAHMEGGSSRPVIPSDLLEKLERTYDILRMLAHKVATMEQTLADNVQTLAHNAHEVTAIKQTLPALVASLVERIVVACLAEQNILLMRGKTARQIWDAHDLPRKIRGSSLWFGNRLAEMGCAIENGGRAAPGPSQDPGIRPDKADICMRNGLLYAAKIYAAERMNQGPFRLVPK